MAGVSFGSIKDTIVELAETAEAETQNVLNRLQVGGSDIGLSQLTEAGIDLDIASTKTATAQKAWTNMNNQANKVTQ